MATAVETRQQFPFHVDLHPGIWTARSGFEICYKTEDDRPLRLVSTNDHSPRIVTLRSPSGSGKSTLLRLLHKYFADPAAPRSPGVGFAVVTPAGETPSYVLAAVVPQQPTFVRHWRFERLVPTEPIFFDAFFPHEDLHDFHRRHLGSFSGGQQKRLYALATLERLLGSPAPHVIFCMDETLDGVGAEAARNILEKLLTNWSARTDKSGVIVWVTHLGDQALPEDYVTAQLTLEVVDDNSDKVVVHAGLE